MKKDLLEVETAQKATIKKDRGLKQSLHKKTLVVENIATQVIFDLLVCKGIFGNLTSDVKSVSASLSKLKIQIEDWQDILDPVNAQLIVPALETKTSDYLSRVHLIFPGLRKSLSTNLTSGSSSQPATSSSAVEGVFTSSISSRFSLLPLPMTSSSSQGSRVGPNISTRDRDAQASNDPKNSIGSHLQKGIASAASSTSMSAASSFIGGLGNMTNFGSLGGFLGGKGGVEPIKNKGNTNNKDIKNR